MRPRALAAVVLLVGGLLTSGEAAPPPSPSPAASPGVQAGPDGMGRLRADRIRYDVRARVMVATGNVTLQLGDLEIRTDALRIEQGPMVANAEGNVKVQQREVRLAAPSLRYEFRTEIAEATGGVVLEQRGATIRAPQIRFDLRAEVTEATGGVEVVQGDATLAAPALRLEGKTSDVTAEGGVILTQPGTRLAGRRLKANLATNRADVREDVTLIRAGGAAPGRPDRATAALAREETTITAGRMLFRWDVNEAEAEDRVVVKQRDKTAWADRMTYSEPANRLVMIGRVVLEQLSGEWLVREGLAGPPREPREREALAAVTRLTGTRLTMTLRERDIELDGPLLVTQKDRSASGDRGTYTEATRRLVVTGNVRMQEADGQRLRADRVVISLIEETFEAEGNVLTEFVVRPGAPHPTPGPTPASPGPSPTPTRRP